MSSNKPVKNGCEVITNMSLIFMPKVFKLDRFISLFFFRYFLGLVCIIGEITTQADVRIKNLENNFFGIL